MKKNSDVIIEPTPVETKCRENRAFSGARLYIFVFIVDMDN